MSFGRPTWYLCIPEAVNTKEISMSELISSLIVEKKDAFQENKARPVMFSLVSTDGTSIMFNEKEGEDKSRMLRMHLPYYCTKVSYTKPSIVDQAFDFHGVGIRKLADMCTRVSFKNSYDEQWRDGKLQSEEFGLKSCFDGLFGTGIVYELDDEDRTMVIPFTSSLKENASVGWYSDKLVGVVVEDIVVLMSESTNIEQFSFTILQGIATGAIYVPDDPWDYNNNNFGDDGDEEIGRAHV